MEILIKRFKNAEFKSALYIYNYFIKNSHSNFEEKKLTLNDLLSIYKKTQLNNLPFILAKFDKKIVGLAFVNKFREKSGYRFTFEHSIYIHPQYIGKGFGNEILKNLIKLCKKNKNIKNLIAVIGGSDNIRSIRIHKNNGFKLVGTIKKAGFKNKRWIDSVYMQKRLWEKQIL